MAFHNWVLNFNFCIAMHLNVILIYVIRKCKQTRIGQYRHVLLMLTIFNMIYSMEHTFIAPNVYNMDYSVVLWVEKKVVLGVNIADGLPPTVLTLFFLSLLVQAYHFIYRFVQICYPKRSYIFQETWFILLAVGNFLVFLVVNFVLWFFLLGRTDATSKVLEPLFQKDLNQSAYEIGYTGFNYKLPDLNGTLHWSVVNLVSYVFIVVIYICSMFILIVYTGTRMVLALRTSTMSKRTLELQNQLLKLLIAQTIAPVCFSYFPPLCSFTTPIFKSSFRINFTVDLPTFFPIMEPIIYFYFVEDYRNYLKSMLCQRIQPASSTSDTEKISTGTNLKTISEYRLSTA